LLFFIITFNYEQFVELKATANQLAEETHERVGAVIGSIVMAIVVIMFYFKGSFNFDKKAKFLKILAQIWVFLNAILVISAMLKNTEYVYYLGLTYKRLGVYAFLSLAIIGLIFTFIKVSKQKTNAYLFNQMFWYVYGTIWCAVLSIGAELLPLII
jgi:cytochrome c oxidase assembly factor CtaG